MTSPILEKLRPIGTHTRNGVESVLDDLFLAPFTEKEIDTVHDTEDTSEKNPIIATYRKHSIFLFKKWITSSLFLLFFLFTIWGVGSMFSLPLSFIFPLLLLIMIPLVLGAAVRSSTYWVANATVIRKKNLVFHKYNGIYSQSTEVRSIAQIKSFDLVQNGVMEYIFNYGDIEVASMISGAATNIILSNISPVKQAYKTLSNHIDSLEEDNDSAEDNEEENE